MLDVGTIVWVGTAVVAAALMEPWAAFAHGVLWHGPLWSFHESHHVEREGFFEKNDLFAVAHAVPAMALFIGGSLLGDSLLANALFGIGIGMTVFGAGYAVVHDGLVHGRLPVRFLLRFRWIKRIHGAHLRHHETGGAPFGMFLGPQELRRAVKAGQAKKTRAA